MGDKLELTKQVGMLAADRQIPEGLEVAFAGLVKFEEDVKKNRKQLIQAVADSLMNAGITKVTAIDSLYRILFLWYIKYGNLDVSMMKLQENRSKFNSIYDLEVAFPDLRASKMVKMYEKEPRRLQYTRSSKLALIIYFVFLI